MVDELVSVVVPVYNMESDLDRCVESILRQNYSNFEVILVDDGSKDGSYNKCMNWQKKDARVHAYHTENRGSGPARNHGIEHANGEYVYFPDADDSMKPDALTRMVEAMKGFDLVVFGYEKIDPYGKSVKVKTYEESSQNANEIRQHYSEYVNDTKRFAIQGAPWNKFFKMSVIREYHVEYPPLRRHQDEGFICRYMCAATKVHFIPDVLYVHYTNDLKKTWDKYPANYYDLIMSLYDIRKETILCWNPEDQKTKSLIDAEFYSRIIKSLELSFSPKMQMDGKERRKWIIEHAKVLNTNRVESLGTYQRLIISLVRAQKYSVLYSILFIKVQFEKNGWI